MTRVVFLLGELVRRVDFESCTKRCVISELGAIMLPAVWGEGGFLEALLL